MRKHIEFSYLSSFTALGVATCCVLPMTMMLLGFGGSWLVIFGKIAAASYYVLAVATLFAALSWWLSLRQGAVSRLKWWLTGSTAVTAAAWVIVFYETQINEFLITQM
ncbi:hypothetical protein [Roseibium album]|uniref:Mercuric ion transport protein n=1 Tax=Roseibium album TaxID=311410 RepID=A0A0M6ZVP2_9HYPH|nr:hypothetical protein [Roseibium album]MBG6162759.1 apolipoprotein N-acyltransferase [Labrenzia sp. EL_195]MBG6201637.1 apolipoprotein N-acyltransferase [Labrenzia sp. EL_13]MCR9056076.1 hypothetical protein [Paracoccaceae bacterium]CTQ58309.1 hypothetical protein LA5094_01067 [Roseibium album]CTQ66130.1 hypothetical protein LA5096_00978 [Roseibium album]